jgi:hypothetical protein
MSDKPINTISVEDMFGSEILNILQNKDFCNIPSIDKGFLSVENIVVNSILFLGINPSFTGKATPNELKFYPIDPKNITYKKYFGKFGEISKHLSVPSWSHMDLLYFRETKQNQIQEIEQTDVGLSFIMQQLEVSKKILETVKPKILIVCNTKARQFLGKDKRNGKNLWMDYDFEFDELIGTYRLTTKNSALYNTPVFFSSMLTGQRALDTGSYERLRWHINMVLESEQKVPSPNC